MNSLRATMHLTPDKIAAVDLSDMHGGDLVVLRLGPEDAQVEVLATLAELRAIHEAIGDALDAIEQARVEP